MRLRYLLGHGVEGMAFLWVRCIVGALMVAAVAVLAWIILSP